MNLQPMNTHPNAAPQQPSHHGYGQPSPAQPANAGYQQPAQPAWQPQQQQQQSVVNNTVVVGQPAAPVVIVQNVRGSDCLGCSIFNMLCCNPVFGLVAVIFSCMAKDAYNRGDNDHGRSHYNVARVMNILGPIITWLSVIVIVVYFVVIIGSVFG
ncbi:uncharacterized protein [Watersipora subatra]|uniref:uncharacterized protein n=1 Tax=Watersipora subatra TaxID=2589382 RepID=UPI00355BDE90